MNKKIRSGFIGLVLTTFLVPGFAAAAPTRFTSPNYGVESVIFGGTGVLRSASASVPPIITSGPSVSGITTTSATVQWVTDKPSNSVVLMGTTPGVYTIQAGDIVNTTFFNHSVTVNNLVRGTQYFYKVRSSDVSGNVVESGESNFTTDPGDITPPVITSGPSIAKNSASLVTVTWETDEVANSLVEFGITSVTENVVGRTDDLTLFHQVQVQGLQSSQQYLMRVRSQDASGNTVFSETQILDTLEAPGITQVNISDITLNSALVQWETTTPSTTVVNYGTSSGNYTEAVNDAETFSNSHLVRLSGLQSGTIYYLRISGTDQAGNRLSSDEYIFQTVILPIISNFEVQDVTSAGARLTWLSSSDIDEFIRYTVIEHDDPEVVGRQLTTGNDVLASQHEFSLADLESGALYSVTVSGKDVFGNQAASAPLQFRTAPDSDPPLIESVRTDTSVDLGSRQTVQVLVSFSLSEMARAYIEYGEGASGDYTKTVETDSEYSRSKLMVIPGLQPGESYHFRIVATDRAGNQAQSADYLVLAPAQPLSLFDLIFGQIRANFGWLANIGN